MAGLSQGMVSQLESGKRSLRNAAKKRRALEGLGTPRHTPEQDGTPEHSLTDWFAVEVRRWRKLRGLSLHELAVRVGTDTETVHRVEHAERRCSPGLARRLDMALRTGGVLTRALNPPTVGKDAGASQHQVPQSASKVSIAGVRQSNDAASGEAWPWHSDLDEAEFTRSDVSADEVLSLVFSWLVVEEQTAPVDAEDPRAHMLRAATRAFAGLDNQFGGAQVRSAAAQYLRDTVAPMLRGTSGGDADRELFSAVAEFVLAVAWMAYDEHEHGLARRYFVRSFQLADQAGDRLLGASVLSAMSHQATYLGEYTRGRDLARAALIGAGKLATATVRAQFLMMEARATAAAGDAAACTRAMAAAETEFVRSRPEEDPEWIGYFDACEFTDELAHCHRDLGRAAAARTHAEECLRLSTGDDYARSRSFSHMVRVAAVLAQNELDEAAALGTAVLPLVERTASARVRGCLDSLVRRFTAHSAHPAVREFLDRSVPVVGGLPIRRGQ